MVPRGTLVDKCPKVLPILHPDLMYQPISALNDTNSAATPTMTVGTHVYLSAVLWVHKFHYWLSGSKKTTYFVKPYLLYKRNESVIKTPFLCVK